MRNGDFPPSVADTAGYCAHPFACQLAGAAGAGVNDRSSLRRGHSFAADGAWALSLAVCLFGDHVPVLATGSLDPVCREKIQREFTDCGRRKFHGVARAAMVWNRAVAD